MNLLPTHTKAVLCLALLAVAGLARASTPALPNIPAYTTNVTQAPYYAKGDGTTTNTTAIQNAINDVSKKGGGTVEIPGPGVYLCGPLTFSNNLNLQIDAGATLMMLPFDQYPGGDVSPANFITASSLHDVEISGAGVIEGQGLPWWKDCETNSAAVRPNMINFPTCTRVLIQDVTLSNSPSPFIVVKGKAGNVTIQRVKVYAPSSGAPSNPSHNTDAIDLAETNAVIRDCIISTGDDNVAVGSSASVSSDILITNCFFGDGHGCSIGSYTSSGVSNLTVINCAFSGTDNGIRLKSQRGHGGVVQNCNYYNLTMTNVDWPILIYSYYEFGLGTITKVDPAFAAYTAATNPTPLTSTTPIWRNLTFNNITATVPSGRPPLMVWGLPEAPASNIVFRSVNITSSSTLDPGIYNATNLQFIDCSFSLPLGVNTVQFWNAGLIFTNSSPVTNLFLLDGLTTNGIGNSLKFYNALGSLKNTNAFDDGPLTLSASTLTVSNNLTLFPTTVLNYVLSTNTTKLAVVGNLMLGGTNNLSAGPGFTNGTYTLITYTGNLNGSVPTLGATPGGAYTYALDTNTAHQVNLLVSSTNSSSPPAITNQPASQVVLAGSNVLFTVGVAGSIPLSYQWWFNSTNRLAAATNISLTISNVQPTNTGSYSVIVTNTAGSATSSVAGLQVFTTAAATLNSPALSSSGQFGLGVAGVPGFRYAVQASTNLVDWEALLTNASPFTFSDTNVALFSNRFYRAVYRP